MISQREDIEELMDDEVSSDFIIEILEAITTMVGEKEFYDTFSTCHRILLVMVALNLMKTTKAEYEQMLKDPDQFVNLALDTCDKQKSKVVKTQGAKLLESICDNLDGAVSYITIFCCSALNYSLKNQ